MPLQLEDTDTLTLSMDPSEGDELHVHQGETDLAGYGDALLVRSDAARIRVELSAPTGWQLSATHELDDGSVVNWGASTLGLAHEFSDPTTDPLELSVTATNGAGATKKKKVYIEAKPGGALPDRG